MEDVSSSAKPEPLATWTPQEQWVWEKICAGEKADFNQAADYGGNLDPKNKESWSIRRVLRQQFLEAIILKEPFRGALSRKGVYIEGAWFVEALDLMMASIACNLILNRCRFESVVYMSGVKTSGLLSFEGSKFVHELNFNSASIENDLFMRNGAEFAAVEMVGTRIGGYLDMSQARFTGALNMNNIRVKNLLVMSSEAEFAEVDLVGAQVAGAVDMRGSRFHGALYMNSLKAQQLVLSESVFENEVKLDTLQTERHVFIRWATFSRTAPIIMDFAYIGANLDLSGSTLSSVSLIGATIRGSLVFGQKNREDQTMHPAVWQPGAKIILNNTAVAALQDLENSWPNDLYLDGFSYSRLGGFGTDRETNMAMRDVSSLKGWLARQKKFSPLPYEQLATALLNAGYREKANQILYSGRERERMETAIRWQNRVWLTLQKLFIGYGYRLHYALYWVLAFIVLGFVVLQATCQSLAGGPLEDIFYSIDTLLPIINLDERYSKMILDGGARYYFYFHKVMGYVLASFMVAGLSGLTKRTK
jgi:uncharacterized protein YjbI with pentapeptide repeats